MKAKLDNLFPRSLLLSIGVAGLSFLALGTAPSAGEPVSSSLEIEYEAEQAVLKLELRLALPFTVIEI